MLLCAASWQGSRNSLRDFLVRWPTRSATTGSGHGQQGGERWGGAYELNLLLVSSVHGVGSPGTVVLVVLVVVEGEFPLVGGAAVILSRSFSLWLSYSGRGARVWDSVSVPAVAGIVVGRGVVVAIGVGKKVLSGGGDEACLASTDRGTRRLKDSVHGPRGPLLVRAITIRIWEDRGPS